MLQIRGSWNFTWKHLTFDPIFCNCDLIAKQSARLETWKLFFFFIIITMHRIANIITITITTMSMIFIGSRYTWGPILGLDLCLSVCPWCLVDLTDKSLVDEDINSILAHDTNRTVPGNLDLQVRKSYPASISSLVRKSYLVRKRYLVRKSCLMKKVILWEKVFLWERLACKKKILPEKELSYEK